MARFKEVLTVLCADCSCRLQITNDKSSDVEAALMLVGDSVITVCRRCEGSRRGLDVEPPMPTEAPDERR